MVIFRKGKVFIPTMARTEAGFYLGVEPVDVLDVTDLEGVEAAIVAAVEKGNPRVPTPRRDEYKGDVLLKHAGVKSLSTFERLARTWNLSKHDGAFQISPSRPGKYGGAEEDLDRQESIPDAASLTDVARRLVYRALNEPADMEGYKDPD